MLRFRSVRFHCLLCVVAILSPFDLFSLSFFILLPASFRLLPLVHLPLFHSVNFQQWLFSVAQHTTIIAGHFWNETDRAPYPFKRLIVRSLLCRRLYIQRKPFQPRPRRHFPVSFFPIQQPGRIVHRSFNPIVKTEKSIKISSQSIANCLDVSLGINFDRRHLYAHRSESWPLFSNRSCVVSNYPFIDGLQYYLSRLLEIDTKRQQSEVN